MTAAPAFTPLQGAPAQRMPVSVVGSLGLHAALFAFLMYGAKNATQQTHVISNVDLMIQVHKAMPVPMAKPAAPKAAPSLSNFLKMALPAVPHLQQMNVAIPEHHEIMPVAEPKLQDRGRLAALPKLNALDMSRRMPSLSALNVAEPEDNHSLKALAALPKLEEVGTRRVHNLPAAIKLDDERTQAQQQLQMGALPDVSEHHGLVAPVGQALQDADGSPDQSRMAKTLSALLPQGGLQMNDRPMPMPSSEGFPKKAIQEEAAASRRASAKALPADASKKGVSIEGPLKNRRVVAYDIPPFPKWAQQQGIMEAEVSIRFWVDNEGNVLDNMRVESTSGFGQLDRLAMDHLKNWKFAPVIDNEKQWGVITFRFVLE